MSPISRNIEIIIEIQEETRVLQFDFERFFYVIIYIVLELGCVYNECLVRDMRGGTEPWGR